MIEIQGKRKPDVEFSKFKIEFSSTNLGNTHFVKGKRMFKSYHLITLISISRMGFATLSLNVLYISHW